MSEENQPWGGPSPFYSRSSHHQANIQARAQADRAAGIRQRLARVLDEVERLRQELEDIDRDLG